MIKFLDLHAQYLSIKSDIDDAIAKVLASSAFIGGPNVKEFEQEFADYLGAEFCIGVANGTDAIEIALEALALPSGSEVIIPGNTFIASSEAVTRSGLKVVFADVDPGNYTLTAETVRAKLTPRTRAIMAVHLYGHPCDMIALKEVADERGLKILEDCAQAHGATCHGKTVGTIGDIATFSFYPGKNFGAYGDAGAIVTGDADLAKRARMIANHGRVAKYDHDFEGRNSRLDGLQAAILCAKLPNLPAWTERRIAIADRYIAELSDVREIVLPRRANWAKQVYHLFVIRTDRRDELSAWLSEKGIETGVHYPVALPKLKAYDYLGQGQEDLFVNRADKTLLSLPIGEHMSDPDVVTVSTAIRSFFG
ncbi:DegT/DnrJ/EryC1/StrS family aminotransferase [Rhizobium ruizarguesonis]|uniref:DegT/DnrJ/EryC1/StrS family aminotransferase n=1 Tax=Rhizobium ruizarguesonis TaxID=2081791 RepID=UPI00102F97D2|nr:DegT/DnrJ/EryC1/StrS family aminotransferase [Rhizobium ruizarguesonis]TAV14325.1 DegT/DnrJ/EryC1/StrS family aminotransferase [Rhizobium ruizarguesonis]TAV26955.1 DegT/DnrJ/EryC1/StrS family aminotransferase [Rhizobium ruizarguesonis]TAW70928.1 DegT/DnrJ/EryC1/StrS family aminotransferase [Rhizobium ruizarguesonis]TAW92269.1 DegT/DnrJ/EryC1/StrS family aminotransferase [Rhizobium ruizarguesonis]TAY45551.1 DegT/DnrJ/EryC1/StrS family aminotransferase [Rhizobium ruizarguesonis]